MARPRRVFHRLADGGLLLVRPVTARDGRRLRQGFEQLSSRSRYQRFLHPLKQISELELRRLLDLDQRDRAAWGAIDLLRCQGIGIARYARLAPGHPAAELAITVVDAWQHRGVGRVLLDQLVTTAADNGITRLVGDMLEDNGTARALFAAFGASFTRGERGLVQVAIEIRPAAAQAV